VTGDLQEQQDNSADILRRKMLKLLPQYLVKLEEGNDPNAECLSGMSPHLHYMSADGLKRKFDVDRCAKKYL